MARQHPGTREHGFARGALLTGTGHPRRRHRVPERGRSAAAAEPARLPTLRDAERTHIQRALDVVRWNKKEAAQLLDISRGTLYRKIEDTVSLRKLAQNRTRESCRILEPITKGLHSRSGCAVPAHVVSTQSFEKNWDSRARITILCATFRHGPGRRAANSRQSLLPPSQSKPHSHSQLAVFA